MEKFSTRLRRILAEEFTAAIDWDDFARPIEVPVWRNYNTIGTRQYLKSMLKVMESRLPATWSITTDPDEIARVKKKWRGKSHPVKMRGIDGMLARKGFRNLFMGKIGGKEVVVKVSDFPL